jgi:hypothetical protein
MTSSLSAPEQRKTQLLAPPKRGLTTAFDPRSSVAQFLTLGSGLAIAYDQAI